MDLSWVKREGDVLYLQQSFRQPIALLIASSQLLRVFMIFMQMAREDQGLQSHMPAEARQVTPTGELDQVKSNEGEVT